MDPILATGLVSLGKNIFDQITTPETSKTGSTAFAQQLQQSQSIDSSPWAQFQSKFSAQNLADVQSLSHQKTQQLLTHPDLFSAMQSFSQGEPIYLKMDADQPSMYLENSSGKKIYLQQSPAIQQLASDIKNLRSVLDQSYQEPTASLPQWVQAASMITTGNWKIQ